MPKLLLRRGSAPDPAGGAYSAAPYSLAGLKGTYTSKWSGGHRKGGGVRGERRGRKGEEREAGNCAPFLKFLDPPLQ